MPVTVLLESSAPGQSVAFYHNARTLGTTGTPDRTIGDLAPAAEGATPAESTEVIAAADIVVNESYNLASRVTEFPVEDGSVIADHISMQPDQLSIRALTADEPAGQGGNVHALGAKTKATFQRLDQMRSEREVLDVTTGFKLYKNMAVTNIRIERSSQVGRSLPFEIQLKQIRIVSSAVASSGLDGGSEPTELGDQPTIAVL